MMLSRVLMVAAALAFTAALPALAQGRGAAQRPAKVATAKGPKARAAKAPKPAKAAKAAKADKVRGANGADRSERADRGVADRIADNPQQRARLEAMLPAGMTLDQAADGFRNQGQFIAALQASKNQNIAFADLKTEMTGTDALSLGQAVQKLKPEPTTTTPAAATTPTTPTTPETPTTPTTTTP